MRPIVVVATDEKLEPGPYGEYQGYRVDYRDGAPRLTYSTAAPGVDYAVLGEVIDDLATRTEGAS